MYTCICIHAFLRSTHTFVVAAMSSTTTPDWNAFFTVAFVAAYNILSRTWGERWGTPPVIYAVYLHVCTCTCTHSLCMYVYRPLYTGCKYMYMYMYCTLYMLHVHACTCTCMYMYMYSTLYMLHVHACTCTCTGWTCASYTCTCKCGQLIHH